MIHPDIRLRQNAGLLMEDANPYVLGAVTLTTVLQLLLIYVEPLRNFFDTHLLSPTELAICFGFSMLMFVWIEMEKLFQRWFLRRH